MNKFFLVDRNRVFVILLLACTLSLSAKVNASEVFIAGSLPGLPVTEDLRGDAYGTIDYTVINGSTLIYPHETKNSTDIYSHDVGNSNSTLLKSIPTTYQDIHKIPLHMSDDSVGSEAFLIIEGKLIVTDGTAAGTKVLRDFGVGLCCHNGAGYFSKATALETLDNIFYFSVSDTENTVHVGDLSTKITLWRSDGSVQGTYPLSEPPALERIVSVFKHKHFDTESLFYFGALGERNNLWKINSTGETELFFSFPDIAGVFGFQTRLISTNKGSFFCTSDTGSDESGQLWRISNSGVLSVIATGCFPDSLTTKSNKIYYENTKGLWFTDGTPLGERLIYSITNSTQFRARPQCDIGDDSYRVLTTGEPFTLNRQSFLVRISPSNTVSVVLNKMALGVLGAGITDCLEDSMIINLEESSFTGNFAIINTRTNELSRIRRLPRGIPQQSISNVSSASYFSRRGHRAPFYLIPVKLAAINPIIDLILSPE